MSQASIDESIRRMSIQDHGTGSVYEDERNANSYNGSRANSVQHQDPYREPPRNAYARTNVRIFSLQLNFFHAKLLVSALEVCRHNLYCSVG